MTDINDMQEFLELYQREFPAGIEGERRIRETITPPFMDTTAEDVHRDAITSGEYNAWRAYMGWSLWDVIAARSTEGESGLIPRQEYETISFLQMWSLYPAMMAEITDAVGVDGLIDMGRTPRREIGTKLNIAHTWSPQNCCHLGRTIALELGLESPDQRRGELEQAVQFARRLAYGTWGGGPAFACGRGYKVALLESEIVERLLASEQRLDDPEQCNIFRKFNAATELLGFLLHYDCRFGLQDTGPYPVPGGGFMIVRDHWLHETAYPWSTPTAGMPYCVTEAMVFRPDEDFEISINDLGTTFSRPRDYLRHLSGVAVFARDTEDTPMSALRLLGTDEMQTISDRASKATIDLYRMLAAKDRDQKIRDGITVYATDHIRPHARAAGIWDKLKPRIDELTELTLAGWPLLADGQAADVLGPLFVKGGAYRPIQKVYAR
jgi:hypothetical protein